MLKMLVPAIAAVLCGCSPADPADGVACRLRDGDIVLRRGRSPKSRAVLMADSAGMFSHAGIAVATDSGVMIVHAVPGEGVPGQPERIRMERPEEFLSRKKACKARIFRIMSPGAAATAAGYARRKYLDEVEFDHDYDLEDTVRMYCTELLWKAYMQSGVDITAGRRSTIRNFPVYAGTYIFPSDICNTVAHRKIESSNH